MMKKHENKITEKIMDVIFDMLRIVVIDDEPIFLEQSRTQLRQILNRNNLVATIEVYQEMSGLLHNQVAAWDICFLDIDFSGKSYTGIDIARQIRKVRKDSILIFLTNYIEYAPEGYEVQAFRYLLKSDSSQKMERYLLDALSFLKERKETVEFKILGESVSILLHQILYIESQKHVAILFVQEQNGDISQRRLTTSLRSLEQQLSTRGFLRIQKSYLVNMRRIQKLRCNEATLDNGICLPVSEKRYSELKATYLLWKER